MNASAINGGRKPNDQKYEKLKKTDSVLSGCDKPAEW